MRECKCLVDELCWCEPFQLSGVILIIQPGTVFQDMGSMYATRALCGLVSGSVLRLHDPRLQISEEILYRNSAGSVGDNYDTPHLPNSFAISSGVLLDNLYLLILLWHF